MKRNLASAVLLLPELLESILLHVDMHTLLMSQRVCCIWYKVKNYNKRYSFELLSRSMVFIISAPGIYFLNR